MTIQRFFRTVFTLFFVLMLALGGVAIYLFINQRNLNRSEKVRFQSYQLADELLQSSNDLTRFARTYVATGDPKYEQYYQDVLAIRNGTEPRPAGYNGTYWDLVLGGGKPPPPGTRAVPLQQLMKELGFTKDEFALLNQAQVNSDSLVRTEAIAMHAVKGLYDDGTGKFTKRGQPNQALAIRLMHDEAYHRQKARIMQPIDRLYDRLDARTAATTESFTRRGNVCLWLAVDLVATLLGLTLLAFVTLRRRIYAPVEALQKQTHVVANDLVRLATVAREIADGDLSQSFAAQAEPLHMAREDEVAQLAQLHDSMIVHLQETGAAIARMTARLRTRAAELEHANEELTRRGILWQREIDERRRAQGQLEREETRLESLLRISQHDADSVQTLLEFALEEAIALTGSKIGYIYSYDEERKEFSLSTWSRDIVKECRIADRPKVCRLEKTGLWGEAVRQRQPILLNDFSAYDRHKRGYPGGHVPLQRYLTIPVFRRERIVGVVGVANREKDYDRSDIRQLTLLMDSVWRITERKEAEEEVRAKSERLEFLNRTLELERGKLLELTQAQTQANEELKRLSEAKSEFVASVSHDLRTPLVTIMESIRLAQDGALGPLTDDLKEYLGYALQETRRLRELINTLLDEAKMEQGKIEVHPTPVDVTEHLHVVSAGYETLARTRSLRITVEAPEQPLRVLCDASHYHRVLTNLVSNAVKFTPGGGRITLRAEPAPGGTVKTAVQDTGLGIPRDQYHRIFQKYEQIRRPDGELRAGTGLGLALCKQLIELNHGTIGFTSEENQGSTFFFSLPEYREPEPENEPTSAQSASPSPLEGEGRGEGPHSPDERQTELGVQRSTKDERRTTNEISNERKDHEENTGS